MLGARCSLFGVTTDCLAEFWALCSGVAVSVASLIPVVLPYKRHIPSILQMTDEETKDLATILKRILVRYDNLFK